MRLSELEKRIYIEKSQVAEEFLDRKQRYIKNTSLKNLPTYRELIRQGITTSRSISDKTGIHKDSVATHLAYLCKAGILKREMKSVTYFYSL